MAERFRRGDTPSNPSPSPGTGSSGFSTQRLVWADQNGALFNNTSGPTWDSTLNSLHLPGATTIAGALHVVGVTITNGQVTVNAGADVNPASEGQGFGTRTTAGNPVLFTHSTGTTAKIGFWTTGGTTRPSSYTLSATTAFTTSRDMLGGTSLSTVTGVTGFSGPTAFADCMAVINNLRGVVQVIVQDLTAYGLLST